MLVSHCVNGIMHGLVNYCHFWRGEYTDLTVRLPDSGEEGLEVSRELASLLVLYSVAVSENISLWEDVVVLEESEL